MTAFPERLWEKLQRRKEGQPDPENHEDALQTLTTTSGTLRAEARLRWDHK